MLVMPFLLRIAYTDGLPLCLLWQYWLWSFHHWILQIGVMGRCQKVPKFDFQSQFSTSKIIWIFLIFFFIEGYQFRRRFFVIVIFWKLQFLTTLFSNFWKSVWTSVNVKSKNYSYFTDFFAKIYSLLTHVRKTPPLRLHY